MKIKQISTFLENRTGRLAELAGILGKAGINIRTMNIAESQDFGILRMLVDQPEEAVKLLKGSGFVSRLTDIVAVEVEDHPGGLAKVLDVLTKHNLNVEYMYAFFEKSKDMALLVIRFDVPDKAVQVLTAAGMHIVGESEINSI